MEIILIILTSAIMGALNLGFFMLGYYVRSKRKEDDAVEINEKNKEAFQELFNWMGYGGNK